MLVRLYQVVFLILVTISIVHAQVDHYETVVYDDDIWSYRLAVSEPPSNWMESTFSDNTWNTGQGGFGYGDNDDNTLVVSGNGVYIRTKFQITDLTDIGDLILDADYDDAFIAYLNGVEVARANIGTIGIPAEYDDSANDPREAQMYQGGDPDRFFLWTVLGLLEEGENTLAVHVLNQAENSSDLSGRFFLSVGMLSSGNTYGALPFWFDPIVDFNSSNLPLVIINTNGQVIEDEPEIVAEMGIIDNGPGNTNFITDPFNDYDGRITIEIRGASSQGFEKKNYRVETQDEFGENNNVSLLGMPEENDWVFHGPYTDKSLIRNVVAQHLGALTGRYAPRNQLCEMYINGEYRGVYLLIEKIKRDNNRVDIAKVTELDIEGDELTGGYLLQIDRDDPDVDGEGWYSDNGLWNYYYVVEDPSYDNILPVQRNYIESYINDFETAMDGSNYLNEYENYLDVGSFADYFIVNELAKHIDAFKLSFYLHKKKDSNGGKLHLGPIWDFNLAFGNFDFDCDPSPNTWINQCTSMANWVNRAITIPAVQDSIHCRWVALRETVYQEDDILDYIDSLAVVLEDPQTRNFEKFDVLGNYVWPNNYIGQTYADEINYLKNYTSLRLDWMDENMLGSADNCAFPVNTNDLENVLEISSFPNPATEIFHVSFSSLTVQNAIFSIYNLEGKLMTRENIYNHESLDLTVKDWASGTYIFNIHQEDGKMLEAGMMVKE